MKLILVRHGETLGNIKRIHEGARRHGRLSAKGKAQAQRLAERLKTMTFDAIYCSDLRRAKQTLTAVKQHHKTPIVYLKELREADAGDFTGKHHDEADWTNPPKNAETTSQVRTRAHHALERALKEHPRGTVLFVSHGFLLASLIKIITGDEKDHLHHNTAVSIFEINKDKKHKVHLINCCEHLPQELLSQHA